MAMASELHRVEEKGLQLHVYKMDLGKFIILLDNSGEAIGETCKHMFNGVAIWFDSFFL